jgi:hypothetical protein
MNLDFLRTPVTASYKEWKSFTSTGWLSEGSGRETHIQNLGFCIMTTETADKLTNLIGSKKVVDVGARTGYMSKILVDRGVDIKAIDQPEEKKKKRGYDSGEIPKWIDIEEIDGFRMDLKPFDVILLSWPDYCSSLAYTIAKRIKKHQILIYQGESLYGCTGDDRFHIYLKKRFDLMEDWYNELNKTHVQFTGLHDRWFVYKRKNR